MAKNVINNYDIAKNVIKNIKNNYFGIEVKIKIITNDLIVLEYEVSKLNIINDFKFNINERIIKDKTFENFIYESLLIQIFFDILNIFKK